MNDTDKLKPIFICRSENTNCFKHQDKSKQSHRDQSGKLGFIHIRGMCERPQQDYGGITVKHPPVHRQCAKPPKHKFVKCKYHVFTSKMHHWASTHGTRHHQSCQEWLSEANAPEGPPKYGIFCKCQWIHEVNKRPECSQPYFSSLLLCHSHLHPEVF